jgi:uncharacterized DUF497 family protein
MDFEWDPEKDRTNQKKHGVGFAEASTALADALSLTRPDPAHSTGEYRFLTLGYTTSGRLVVVAHADRERRVRIISARHATAAERKNYEAD